jgi:hypothetical protein
LEKVLPPFSLFTNIWLWMIDLACKRPCKIVEAFDEKARHSEHGGTAGRHPTRRISRTGTCVAQITDTAATL